MLLFLFCFSQARFIRLWLFLSPFIFFSIGEVCLIMLVFFSNHQKLYLEHEKLQSDYEKLRKDEKEKEEQIKELHLKFDRREQAREDLKVRNLHHQVLLLFSRFRIKPGGDCLKFYNYSSIFLELPTNSLTVFYTCCGK